jgi:uncharacterized membrane protein
MALPSGLLLFSLVLSFIPQQVEYSVNFIVLVVQFSVGTAQALLDDFQ